MAENDSFTAKRTGSRRMWAVLLVPVGAAVALSACGGGGTPAASPTTSSTSAKASASHGSSSADTYTFCEDYTTFSDELRLAGSIDLSSLSDISNLQAHYDSFAKEVSNSQLKHNLQSALAILNPVVNAGGQGSQSQSSSLKTMIPRIDSELASEAKSNCGPSGLGNSGNSGLGNSGNSGLGNSGNSGLGNSGNSGLGNSGNSG